MRPIILLMLLVQIAIVLVTLYTVAWRKPSPERPRPVWSSLAISLFVTGMASSGIASNHFGERGDDVVAFFSAIVIGMALVCLAMQVRERRQRQAGSAAAL